MDKCNEERVVGQVMGMDLGDREAVYHVLGGTGEGGRRRGKVKLTRSGLEKLLGAEAPMRVVMEAGAQSAWVSRRVAEMGHEVVVANPRQVKLISRSHTKNDRKDAELLARLGRADVKLLSPIKHKGKEVETDRMVLKVRGLLVKQRTELVNFLRSAVKGVGGRLPKCSTRSLHKKLGEVPEELNEVVGLLAERLEGLTGEILALDRELERLCKEKYPETGYLRQVKGVGPVTALTYVLTIESVERFPRARHVASYAGLRPRQQESGAQKKQLGITKAGNNELRWSLVQAAHYVMGPFGPETALKQWGQKLAKRGGKNAKRRAVVAVARKLSVLLLALWRDKSIYEPTRGA